MFLFEIVTGQIGVSYERCYVWAKSLNMAFQMYKDTHGDRIIHSVKLLFKDTDKPFITKLDSEGFER